VARNETLTSTLVAAVLIPVAVGAMYLGGWVLAALLAAACVLSALELFRMVGLKGPRALPALGAAGAVALVAARRCGPRSGWTTRSSSASWRRSCSWRARPPSGRAASPATRSSRWRSRCSGAVYTGLLLFALFLRHLPGVDSPLHGMVILLAPVVLTWINDSFAYFGGRTWGKRKLIPRVSPGKTVEGAVCALFGTLLSAVGYAFLLARFPSYQMGIVEAAAFGVLISVSSQTGDLAESLFKRDVGVKDSGKLLPGHGGALDRFDSLFFTLPIGYAFFRYVVGV
jgi:phosphatidate cytidylyltransferase